MTHFDADEPLILNGTAAGILTLPRQDPRFPVFSPPPGTPLTDNQSALVRVLAGLKVALDAAYELSDASDLQLKADGLGDPHSSPFRAWEFGALAWQLAQLHSVMECPAPWFITSRADQLADDFDVPTT